MTASALVLMLSAWSVVTFGAGWCLWRILDR